MQVSRSKAAIFGRFLLIAFLVAGGFLLVVEHRTHLAPLWPLLFLLPCVLMHRFMHGGHGGHGGERDGGPAEPAGHAHPQA